MVEEAFAGPTSPFHHTAKASSGKRKMAPELGFGLVYQDDKKGRGQGKFPYTQGPWNPHTPTPINSKPTPGFRPNAYPSSLSSFTSNTNPPLVNLDHQHSPFSLSNSTISSPTNNFPQPSPLSPFTSITSPTTTTVKNHTPKAPDSHAISTSQTHLQTALTEATKRATLAELKAADHLQAKANLDHKLHDQQSEATALIATNKHLTAENESLKTDLDKAQKHIKNCDKATGKAQKEAQHAKGYADHLIKSQKGQLRNAERRYEDAARELTEWKERYGWVGKPAEENAALQKSLSEWQSKAEKAQNEIATMKGALRAQQSAGEPQIGIKIEENESRIEAEEDQSMIKVEDEDASIAAAEAEAVKYKAERDTLHRMLQEEMTKNAKLAESLVLRNAKLAKVLGGLETADDREV